MKDLLIFGNGKIADVIYYYAKNECNFNVVAFNRFLDQSGITKVLPKINILENYRNFSVRKLAVYNLQKYENRGGNNTKNGYLDCK